MAAYFSADNDFGDDDFDNNNNSNNNNNVRMKPINKKTEKCVYPVPKGTHEEYLQNTQPDTRTFQKHERVCVRTHYEMSDQPGYYLKAIPNFDNKIFDHRIKKAYQGSIITPSIPYQDVGKIVPKKIPYSQLNKAFTLVKPGSSFNFGRLMHNLGHGTAPPKSAKSANKTRGKKGTKSKPAWYRKSTRRNRK
jgi:hypothetical protein